MSKEGMGCLDDECPRHGVNFLFRKCINGLWHDVCSAQGCDYKNVVWKERKQNQPIPFEDRRKNVY
jgi:hypothetical protein